MKHLSNLLLALALTLLPAQSFLSADENASAKPKELEPSKLMQVEASWLAHALQRAHYSKVSVEKVNPEEFLETYMKRLDRQRLYFLQGDRDKYLKDFVPTIATYLKQGNLFPGFRIYNDYRTKAVARLSWVLQRLKGDFKFDENETFVPDREKLPWAKNDEEANEIWEKRLKYEMLAEVLNQIKVGGE